MSKSAAEVLEHVESLLTISKSKAFLGREFLSWLWYLAETLDGPVTIKGMKSHKEFLVDVWVDDQVILESLSAKTHVHSIRGGEPSKSAEAAVALFSGKSVKEMKLGLYVDGFGEFTAVFASDGLSQDGLAPRAVQLPIPDDGDKSSDVSPLETRIRQLDVFLDIFDSLFAKFITARSAADWETAGLSEIRSWVKQRVGQEARQIVH